MALTKEEKQKLIEIDVIDAEAVADDYVPGGFQDRRTVPTRHAGTVSS